jgi:microcystin-dependent protein
MENPYVGEVALFPYNFAPSGWLPCDGREMSVNSNQALFALIGNMYGGDGMRSFRLPKLEPVKDGDPSAEGPKVGYFIAVQGIFPMRD